MTSELRKKFEAELQYYLKDKLSSSAFIKVIRNEVKLTVGQVSGRIGFRFLNNAQGYILSESVSLPELRNFYNQVTPSYRPNFTTNFELVMNTSMEHGFKSFSPNMGGTVDLPRNEDEREKTCEWIYTKVKDIYLPRVMNLIELKPETINDVIAHPEYYAYPFLTILYIIKKNNIPLSELNMESILSKKVSGNRSFDKNLLDTYL
ncbi:hypothetical protein HM25_002482 [Salmonella enterica subsp. enterica serovar Carno]|nr:hypothetical protein [Salmonella enterica]ECC9475163.1 hypothetical protein [Salmonella enterica subsp. enterica]EDQ9968435.1 hypothetical protein [Salmonella enterica subsp. enterica serovar Java]EDV9642760.1 hypothetical protein [Salmonella enterica subsp. enterica serovar Carno]ECD2883918.1 hypothetical protein [Salmonella enterica subsp. enterica]ECD4082934.1 hypothetical protein [Salmonella enterica subsp. enterica]